MTSTAIRTARPVSDPEAAENSVSPVPRTASAESNVASRSLDPATLDSAALCEIAAEAAREITGVCPGVQVRADIARGSAVLTMRVPIRYPMPIWRVTTACRTHVLERMRERCGIALRRFDIEVGELTELVR